MIMYRLALGMECRVIRSGSRQFHTPSERASWYVLKGAICSLSEVTLAAHHLPCLTGHLIYSDALSLLPSV